MWTSHYTTHPQRGFTATHLATLLLGDNLGSINVLLVVLSLLAQEHQQVRLDLATEDLLGGLLVEFDHEGQRELGDERLQRILGDLILQLVTLLVKLRTEKASSL